jgi:hypothetical protein
LIFKFKVKRWKFQINFFNTLQHNIIIGMAYFRNQLPTVGSLLFVTCCSVFHVVSLGNC